MIDETARPTSGVTLVVPACGTYHPRDLIGFQAAAYELTIAPGDADSLDEILVPLNYRIDVFEAL